MEHDVHLADDVDRGGLLSKIIAILVVATVLLSITGYVVFGSGMWA